MTEFTDNYNGNLHLVNTTLRVGESFDIIVKRLKIGGRRATLYGIDGFIKDEMLEKELEYLSKLTKEQMDDISDADEFCDTYVTYIETSAEESPDKFITFILSGAIVKSYKDEFSAPGKSETKKINMLLYKPFYRVNRF